MSDFRITCGGSVLALHSPDGISADLQGKLIGQLSYIHMHHLRGAAAYHPITGDYSPVRSERRELYMIDRYGRLCCGLGFVDRVRALVIASGHSCDVDYTDGWRDHPRKDRFLINREILKRYEFRPTQLDCLETIFSNDRATIVACPGYGKTFLFKAIAESFPNARIHIIAEGLDIQDRIIRDLVHSLPNVGVVNGSSKKFGRITVVSADSLMAVDGEDRTSNHGADIVLGDEGHRLLAQSYLEPLARYQYARMYWFTATPTGRSDQSDIKMEGFAGPIRFCVTYPEGVKLGIVSPMLVEWINIDGPSECRNLKGARKDKVGIWQNAHRNRLIAERLSRFADDVQILALVETIEHAVELKQFLPGYKLCYGNMDLKRYQKLIERGLLNPSEDPILTPYLRRQMREDFESRKLMKVIATDVWSTGVDFQQLEVVVRADGSNASEITDYQAPGRASRKHEDKEYGLIIDCMDSFDKTYRTRSLARRRNYVAQGWAQVGVGSERLRRKRSPT